MISTKEERRRHVGNMIANFALEGDVPDAEHMALLDQYIDGTVTLAGLLDHAREYALFAQKREQEQRAKEERSLLVAQMREQFAQDGGIPIPEKEALLDPFIEGTATLAELFHHAFEYVTSAQQREGMRLAKERAAPDFERLRQAYEASIPAYEEERKQKIIERRAMGEEQRGRREGIEAARANVELSGADVSEESWQRSLRYANCEMTLDEYLAGYSTPPVK